MLKYVSKIFCPSSAAPRFWNVGKDFGTLDFGSGECLTALVLDKTIADIHLCSASELHLRYL